ncbi:MAG: glycosyltransferase family 9 protein [Candidatus Saganbacteria bacterium]|nr:glycosyltransferase family 9 protein [Candidatus Saganbacteria bacterium]
MNTNELVIGINLGTGKSNRPWLAKSFIETINLLTEKLGAKIILVGGPKDKEKEAFILNHVKHPPLSQVGIPPYLPELISLISQCKIFITVDTGLMHIAAALKIPTVALFPAKIIRPSEWGPWQTPHVILSNSSACKRKCIPSNCTYDDCLKGITPEAVLDAVKLLLGK